MFFTAVRARFADSLIDGAEIDGDDELRATRALLWVRGSEHTAQAASGTYTDVLRGGKLPAVTWRYEPEAVTGQNVTLSGLAST